MEQQNRYKPSTEVQYVRGVGPKVAKILEKLGIKTLGDLLYYLPRRYEDRTNFRPIANVKPGEWVTLKGRVIAVDSRSTYGRALTLVKAAITDGLGSIGLVWFNQRWVKAKLEAHQGEIIVYGQAREGQWGLEIPSPEWEAVDASDSPEDFARITPVYGLAEGVNQKLVRRVMKSALELAGALPDVLPRDFQERYRVGSLAGSLRQAHFPSNEE